MATAVALYPNAEMIKVPRGGVESVNFPLASVAMPTVVPWMTTAAPITGAPCESVTVPLTGRFCAAAWAANPSTTTTKSRSFFTMGVGFLVKNVVSPRKYRKKCVIVCCLPKKMMRRRVRFCRRPSFGALFCNRRMAPLPARFSPFSAGCRVRAAALFGPGWGRAFTHTTRGPPPAGADLWQ